MSERKIDPNLVIAVDDFNSWLSKIGAKCNCGGKDILSVDNADETVQIHGYQARSLIAGSEGETQWDIGNQFTPVALAYCERCGMILSYAIEFLSLLHTEDGDKNE